MAEAQESTEKHKNPNFDPAKNNIVSKLPFLRVCLFLKLSPELLEAFADIRSHFSVKPWFYREKNRASRAIGRHMVNYVTRNEVPTDQIFYVEIL